MPRPKKVRADNVDKLVQPRKKTNQVESVPPTEPDIVQLIEADPEPVPPTELDIVQLIEADPEPVSPTEPESVSQTELDIVQLIEAEPEHVQLIEAEPEPVREPNVIRIINLGTHWRVLLRDGSVREFPRSVPVSELLTI